MGTLDSGLAIKQSAAQMVSAYEKALKEAAEGLNILANAEKRLNEAFGGNGQYSSFYMIDRNYGYWQYQKPDEYYKTIHKQVKKSAWKAILDGLQIGKIASQKRKDELYKQLENGELPELTLAAIYDQLEAFMQNAGDIRKECYQAAYDHLRPDYKWQPYKTNAKSLDAGIGKKVILKWMVQFGYAGREMHVIYNRVDKLIEIDKAFHMLDGKPFATEKSYAGPLVDAINTAKERTGKTDYFEFYCYGNGNLHLTFLRHDLVSMLNQICGDGVSLKSGKYTQPSF